MLQDKVIDENTQVWDESNKCWLALHHCELTKGLIQNALLQPVAEVADVTETTEVNNVVPEPDTIQNVEAVDTEIPQNIDHQSASLWDAWDESSIRVIVDGEVDSILSSNVPSTTQDVVQDLPEIDLTELEISQSENSETQSEIQSETRNINLNQNQDGANSSKEHYIASDNPFLMGSNVEMNLPPSDQSMTIENSPTLDEEIDIDLEQSFEQSFENESTSDIPMLELDELVDRQAELEKELAADMMAVAERTDATNEIETSAKIPTPNERSATQKSRRMVLQKTGRILQKSQKTPNRAANHGFLVQANLYCWQSQ